MSKVLIVDDEPQYGEYLREWLMREGHEVKTAITAEDAIDYGKRWQPHVLVADWMLASPLDGLHVTEAVRAANPTLQTILITGYPSQELKARAKQAQVFSFIEKPFSLSEVAGAVRQAACAGRPALPGHILIVSESLTVRNLARDTLQTAGYTCHIALSSTEAQMMLRDDKAVHIAILDCMSPETDLGILAEELRAIRPDVIVIGSSEGPDAERFAFLSIERFLPRFWTVDDLHRLLIVRIASCTECGLPLPLRFPLPGDTVGRWECAMCGARYQAVMSDDASADAPQNIRAAQN